MTVKIFKLNDCDWVAAESLEQAKQYYTSETGMDADDGAFEDEYELDDAEMDSKVFRDVEGDFGVEDARYTFRQALDLMLARGDAAPFLFASTEY